MEYLNENIDEFIKIHELRFNVIKSALQNLNDKMDLMQSVLERRTDTIKDVLIKQEETLETLNTHLGKNK